MEKDNFYNSLAAHTEYNGGSGHMQQAQMIDGALYTVRSRREEAELERAKRRDKIGIPNIDEGIQWAVSAEYNKRWNTERIATTIGKPGAYVNRLLEEFGINPNKTHFEASGPPVAAVLFLGNPEFFEEPPTKERRKAALDEVKAQYQKHIEKLEAEKATQAQISKPNVTKNKKNGRG